MFEMSCKEKNDKWTSGFLLIVSGSFPIKLIPCDTQDVLKVHGNEIRYFFSQQDWLGIETN